MTELKASQMGGIQVENETYSVEEYKFTMERIKAHDDRRYQLIVLCVTGFAATFGFSSQMAVYIVPFVLLTVLFICSTQYSVNKQLQDLNTAFIVEKYEKSIASLDHETGYLAWSLNPPLLKGISKAKGVLGFLREPFVPLTVISLIGGAVFAFDSIASNAKTSLNYVEYMYLLLWIVGHTLVLLDIQRRRKIRIDTYCQWWREYLSKEATRGKQQVDNNFPVAQRHSIEG